MAVCLCDAEVYVVENAERLKRNYVLSFFMNDHTDDYLLLYDENANYIGIITYKSLLSSIDLEGAIIKDKLFVEEDDFWGKAHNLLENEEGRECVPVFNRSMELLYLAKYDVELTEAWRQLCELKDYFDNKMWINFEHYEKQVHIKGLNDVFWELRKWLILLGVEVSVEGEQWKQFGIEEGSCRKKDIVIADFCWLNDLYLEWHKWLDEYSLTLKKMLDIPCINENEGKEKVLFYLPPFPDFVDSISPLIERYLQSEKECILVFTSIENIINKGTVWIDKMVKSIEKLKAAGARFYDINERALFCGEYFICFLCSEFSGRLPLELRKLSKYVVALQTTALYMHMYQIEDRYDMVFSEQARRELDFLVTSDYMADWICQRNKKWDEKILRFGYPKMDALYYQLKKEPDIPERWKSMIGNKKVYLFTTYSMEQSWLELFEDEKESKIAIWRPHPLSWARTEEREKIKQISETYDIIIDDMPSYYVAFQISDALIASLHSSVMVNYLYTGKPICTHGGKKTYQQAVIDYKEELWYKCAYNVVSDKEVLDFVKMVDCNEYSLQEEQIEYRRRIISNFDGEVCNRIYTYFEKRDNRRIE